MKHEKSEDDKTVEAIAAALGASPETPKPPGGWWREHMERIEEEHPEYDKARINLVVGAIWYKVYSKDRRECAVLAEALHRS